MINLRPGRPTRRVSDNACRGVWIACIGAVGRARIGSPLEMELNGVVEPELWYTLGPTSLGKERDLLINGATGVRLTFGFGTPSLHYERAVLHKNIASELGTKCLTIADLNGERFRLGKFDGPPTIPVAANTEVHFVFAELTAPCATVRCYQCPTAHSSRV